MDLTVKCRFHPKKKQDVLRTIHGIRQDAENDPYNSTGFYRNINTDTVLLVHAKTVLLFDYNGIHKGSDLVENKNVPQWAPITDVQFDIHYKDK